MVPRIVREFSQHWLTLNALLPPDQPLLVLEELPAATLETMGTELAALEKGHDTRQVGPQMARAAVVEAEARLRVLTKAFNAWVRLVYAGRVETRMLAAVVSAGVAVDKVVAMAVRTLVLWEKIADDPARPEGFAPVLREGEDAAQYAAALTAYEEARGALLRAELEEDMALAQAEVLREEIVAVATAYGHAVQGRLRSGDPRRAALPELWHPGGRGPKRV